MNPTAGISLKPQHFEEAMASSAVGLWFEVHAENYMVAGGARLAMLDAARALRPLSLHGVGLSLASPEPPDADHLAALKQLVQRYEPFLVSEHLAWSRHGGYYLPDLLPFPRSTEALQWVCRNIDVMQSELACQVLIENPSHYLVLEGHMWSETDFLAEIVRRTGCGLLLDLNNVSVSAANIGFNANDYLDDFPTSSVVEIHLAGALKDEAAGLLIDNHGSPVAEPVWQLLDNFTRHHGTRPILIEWDRDLPRFDQLMNERDHAVEVLEARFEDMPCLN